MNKVELFKFHLLSTSSDIVLILSILIIVSERIHTLSTRLNTPNEHEHGADLDSSACMNWVGLGTKTFFGNGNGISIRFNIL